MYIFVRVALWFLAISSITTLSFSLQAQSLQSKLIAQQNASARSVSETVSLAIASHPKLQASLSDLNVRRQQLKKLKSEFFPQVSVGLGIGREDSNNSATSTTTGLASEELERREASIFVNQMLFDGFETHWLRESELNGLDAANFAIQNLANEVALKAIESHLAVAKNNRVLNDNIENLKAHERIAKNIGIRARSGKDDRAKVSQISARLSLSLANVEAAKNNVMQSNADYFRHVGESPGRELHFQNKLFRMPENQSDFIEEVLRLNPFVASNVKVVQSFVAAEQAARHTDFPTLHIESGASWNDNLDGVKGRNNDAFIMLRLRYDLFAGGGDKAEKGLAKYRSQQSQYDLDDVRRDIRRDAEQAWFSYQSSARRVSFLQDYTESAQTTLRAYVKQFNIGQRSLIDLLDAENELLRAKRQLVDAQNDLYLSKYQIMSLKGQLLSVVSAEALTMLDGMLGEG